MTIINGRKIAADALKKIKKEVSELSFVPEFCDVLVGSDPASAQYVAVKAAAAERVGIKFKRADFPATINQKDLLAEIKELNKNFRLCGLILQLPLPESLNTEPALNAIDPGLDVDCIGKVNSGLFYSGRGTFAPPTAAAIMKILNSIGQSLAKKSFLVIGRGQLVGRPVEFLLSSRGYKVRTADSATKNIQALVKQADVVISAAGRPGLLDASDVKSGAIIIDAGTSESKGGIAGDVDFESLKNISGWLSPVPGGVGPVTVAMLLQNVLKAAKNKNGG